MPEHSVEQEGICAASRPDLISVIEIAAFGGRSRVRGYGLFKPHGGDEPFAVPSAAVLDHKTDLCKVFGADIEPPPALFDAFGAFFPIYVLYVERLKEARGQIFNKSFFGLATDDGGKHICVQAVVVEIGVYRAARQAFHEFALPVRRCHGGNLVEYRAAPHCQQRFDSHITQAQF